MKNKNDKTDFATKQIISMLFLIISIITVSKSTTLAFLKEESPMLNNVFHNAGYTYTLRYDANLPAGQSLSLETPLPATITEQDTVPQHAFLVSSLRLATANPSYMFKGWSTNQNATVAEYKAGDSFAIFMEDNQFVSDTTLYGVWSGEPKLKDGKTFVCAIKNTSTSSVANRTVTQIIFGSMYSPEYADIINNSTNTQDVSSENNGSVMAYNCGEPTVYVLADAPVGAKFKANENSSSMFQSCSGLLTLDLSCLDTSTVTNMNAMFSNCSSLTTLDLSDFNTTNVNNMNAMFNGCSSLTALNISNFDTSNVIGMNNMFGTCRRLQSLDLSSFNTERVTTTSGMFLGCSGLITLDLSNFNTANVTNTSSMFNACSALASLNLSGFSTVKVTNMSYMFTNCRSLTALSLNSFNTSSTTNMSFLFGNCYGLTSLDISGFNTIRVNNMSSMFENCQMITSIYVSNSFSTINVTQSTDMFIGCTSIIGGNGTLYDSSYVDAAYARIDSNGSPGYFTEK